MEKQSVRDNLFDEDLKPQDFTFDERVARVFDDMVSRSVPFYHETRSTALGLAQHFVEPKTTVVDVGCSTATLLLEFADLVEDGSVKLLGIDASAPMLHQAEKKINESKHKGRIKLYQTSVETPMGIQNASVVFMNYTLQFVRPLHREGVLKQIYEGLNQNGAFILVEKVLGNDSLFNRLYIELYYAYKTRIGYTDKEIKQKREALENVLIPYRIDENVELLNRCGFNSVDIFFKWYNFAGIVAVKN